MTSPRNGPPASRRVRTSVGPERRADKRRYSSRGLNDRGLGFGRTVISGSLRPPGLVGAKDAVGHEHHDQNEDNPKGNQVQLARQPRRQEEDEVRGKGIDDKSPQQRPPD